MVNVSRHCNLHLEVGQVCIQNLWLQVYDFKDKYTYINNFVKKSYHHFIRGIASVFQKLFSSIFFSAVKMRMVTFLKEE